MKIKFETEKADWFFVIPTILIWIASLLITAWDFYYLQKTPSFGKLNALGFFLFLVGLMIRLVSKRALGDSYSYGLNPPKKLVKSGIYKHIRHPIYLAMLLYTMGVPLIFSSFFGFFVASGFIPLTLYRIKIEEKMLISKFGEDYLNYMKKTKKLIPLIY